MILPARIIKYLMVYFLPKETGKLGQAVFLNSSMVAFYTNFSITTP